MEGTKYIDLKYAGPRTREPKGNTKTKNTDSPITTLH